MQAADGGSLEQFSWFSLSPTLVLSPFRQQLLYTPIDHQSPSHIFCNLSPNPPKAVRDLVALKANGVTANFGFFAE